MTCIKPWILSEPLVDPIDSQDILTTSKKFYDVNLEKVFNFLKLIENSKRLIQKKMNIKFMKHKFNKKVIFLYNYIKIFFYE